MTWNCISRPDANEDGCLEKSREHFLLSKTVFDSEQKDFDRNAMP